MTEIVIHIDPQPLLAVLNQHGWSKGNYSKSDGSVCLHGAIRLCAPINGDAQIIEQVARKFGWGPNWNDAKERTEDDVRELCGHGINITDEMLAETFGSQWLAIVGIVRKRYAADTAADTAAADAAATAVYAYADAAADTAAAATAVYAYADAYARMICYTLGSWGKHSKSGPFTIANRNRYVKIWEDLYGPIEGLIR